jgi:hypothetical protein
VKTKRTGHDVLQQLHALMQLVQSHPAGIEAAAHGMTPEQLRRAHEGLSVLMHCIREVPAAAVAASALAPVAGPSKAGSKPRQEPATESG